MTESTKKVIEKKRLGWFIIGNAIVWGVVMIATSLVLGGTGHMPKVLPILGGGAGFCVVILPVLLTGKDKTS